LAPTTNYWSSDQYRSLIVAYRNGAPVQLADIATVSDGVENVKQAGVDETKRRR
jgi:multidrug efflux pump